MKITRAAHHQKSSGVRNTDCGSENSATRQATSFTDNTTGDYEHGTPQRLFDELNEEFHFTVDVCANEGNHKCQRFYDKKMNGLIQDWSGETVWCNPPYGQNIVMWVKKCSLSHATVVALVPSRTDSRWWHQFAMTAHEIRFICGRLRFKDAKDGAKFPSSLLIWRNLSPVSLA